jgi:hypothetical protein
MKFDHCHFYRRHDLMERMLLQTTPHGIVNRMSGCMGFQPADSLRDTIIILCCCMCGARDGAEERG